VVVVEPFQVHATAVSLSEARSMLECRVLKLWVARMPPVTMAASLTQSCALLEPVLNGVTAKLFDTGLLSIFISK
jgi:hypothetical protein